MRIIKLILDKANSSWRAASLSLDKQNPETKSFDFDALDPCLQRSINRAQDSFGFIKIIDLEDQAPQYVVPPLPETTVPEPIPDPDPLEPEESDVAIAMMISGDTVSSIKASVSEWPKNLESKRTILALITSEKNAKKPRKTLLAFLEDAFLAIPEGE
jgi:hypothetical protein